MPRAARDFLGYPVESFKLWVFVFSAVIAGVAGALYVPQIGIINPSEFAPINSIEAVIWVAVGGRGTLYGAIVGAVMVNYAKTYLTGAFPEVWLYALGALFVLVTLFLPRGIVGLMPARGKDKGTPNADAPLEESSGRAGGEMMARNKRLYLEDLTVSFDGFKALDQRSLYVDPGEMLCIIGPNGAGKTTMMDVITGKTQPGLRHGLVRRRLRSSCSYPSLEIVAAGIGRKFPEAHRVRAADGV